ncbi:hypothetical protein ACJX0J_008838, partial [Zea mays]
QISGAFGLFSLQTLLLRQFTRDLPFRKPVPHMLAKPHCVTSFFFFVHVPSAVLFNATELCLQMTFHNYFVFSRDVKGLTLSRINYSSLFPNINLVMVRVSVWLNHHLIVYGHAC